MEHLWHYALVFFGAMAVDITPLPLPPAFTVMVFLQIRYHLPIEPVIAVGVAGSIMGRLILTLYIPKVATHIFNQSKNEDVQFLGNKLKTEVWKGQLFILLYTLMPLPSTPLFIAGGIAKMKPLYIIPAFVIGKLVNNNFLPLTVSLALLSASPSLFDATTLIEPKSLRLSLSMTR